jgi:hypothetical protein
MLKTDQAALKKALQYRQLVVRGSASDIPLKIGDARANRWGLKLQMDFSEEIFLLTRNEERRN